MNINPDLIRGHIDTVILNFLEMGDKYGYEISKQIKVSTEGEYEIKEATLYSSLKRLERENSIISYWGDETQGGRRKYYKITDSGKSLLNKNKLEWEFTKKIISKLI
ncbi:MAG: PadR family transcriptional regulator [Ignavibacteria bacterium GWF2_33_9]|nr:MAG: PadR family transcriptional regulator [Ignavibacteria bacterium GWF2_33_9]